MSEEMLIRLEGGDVIRRAVERVDRIDIPGQEPVVSRQHPVLNDDEIALWVISSPIPLVVKRR